MELHRQTLAFIRRTLTRISPKLNTSVLYYSKFGKRLDLKTPETLNEKNLWLKFHTYWNNQLVKQCADKYLVREYVKEAGCGKTLNNLIAVYEKPEDLNLELLPNQFVLKLNIGCGFNHIVTDKAKENQDQIRTQLSFCLRGIISQVLIKNNFDSRSAAFECLIGTDAILNLIRNNKLHEIKSLMQMGLNDGMNTLERNIFDLVKQKKINYDDGLKYCNDKSDFEQYFLN